MSTGLTGKRAKMNMRILVLGLMGLVAIAYAGCSSGTGSESDPDADRQALIRDRTGREWDVTHARDVYGMDPSFFNFGLGVGAIPSVDGPEIIAEGEPGYPEPDSGVQVFGVDHNGEQRAYSVSALTRHEVFNDIFPGESDRYLAVTF